MLTAVGGGAAWRPCRLQVAVIEFARNILGYTSAHSAEFDEATQHQLIVFMPEVSRSAPPHRLPY